MRWIVTTLGALATGARALASVCPRPKIQLTLRAPLPRFREHEKGNNISL
jgi:hypothetical protein